MPSEFFFSKIRWQNPAKANVLAVNYYCTCIFNGSNCRFSHLLFGKYFKNSYLDTSISNYLQTKFLEFFLYWFYMFNLYTFIFQRLIWKTISVYFLWSYCWTLKEWKTAKVQNHSVSTYYLFTQMIAPLKFWHVYCSHAYFFYARCQNVGKPITGFYLFWWASPPGLAFYGSGPAHLPRWLEIMNPGWLFHAIRNFLATEVYYFWSLSHLTGCFFFTWADCSI